MQWGVLVKDERIVKSKWFSTLKISPHVKKLCDCTNGRVTQQKEWSEIFSKAMYEVHVEILEKLYYWIIF